MNETELIGVGGHPALALLNSTAQPQTDGLTVELLGDGPALLEWLLATGLLTENEANDVSTRYSSSQLDKLADDVVELREWWRSNLVRVVEDVDDFADVLDHLNELLAHTSTYTRLEPTDAGVVLAPRRRWTAAIAVLALIAEAIADLIVSDAHHLIRKCDNPTCTLWFYDQTKAHRRRWCSMAVCGNRAKARAHRDRQRNQTAFETVDTSR